MLVLSRQVGQAIDVDGPCEVTLLGMKKGKASIGLVAPRSTQIQRDNIDHLPLDQTGFDSSRLIIKRKINQVLTVDGPCKIWFLSWSGTNARFGFQMPATTRVLRKEAINRKPKPGREAA